MLQSASLNLAFSSFLSSDPHLLPFTHPARPKLNFNGRIQSDRSRYQTSLFQNYFERSLLNRYLHRQDLQSIDYPAVPKRDPPLLLFSY